MVYFVDYSFQNSTVMSFNRCAWGSTHHTLSCIIKFRLLALDSKEEGQHLLKHVKDKRFLVMLVHAC